MRFVGALLIIATGCTTGDAPVEPNGRLCGTSLSANGTFTPDPAAMPNPDGTGCWPYGAWKFTMSIVQNDCSAAPTLLAQYQFSGHQMINMDGDIVPMYTYDTDPASTRTIVKVSEGGSGLCEGEIDLYSTDGKKVFVLKPELNADNTITGDGEYTEFGSDQWPFN